MNNFEKLKSMSVDELAKWLDEHGIADDGPWDKYFNNTYCKNCESIMCRYEDNTREFPVAWCEINDTCKFFPNFNYVPGNEDVVKLWLESEAEE